MMHGLTESSYCWLFNSAELAPAFIFAREGYDVWLGNNRGNGFSRRHVTMSNTSKEFWDPIDFEEMGTFDSPAMINYAIKSNGKHDSLAAFVGHSEGTT